MVGPPHKAPLCVYSGFLTEFDGSVLTGPFGSNVFEMEIYSGMLFLHVQAAAVVSVTEISLLSCFIDTCKGWPFVTWGHKAACWTFAAE